MNDQMRLVVVQHDVEDFGRPITPPHDANIEGSKSPSTNVVRPFHELRRVVDVLGDVIQKGIPSQVLRAKWRGGTLRGGQKC